MLTIVFILVLALVIGLISMVILPVASVLALPILLDAMVIVALLKLFSRGDKKGKKKKGEET